MATIGPRIGTKFTTKAITPHSSGLATPHAHITPERQHPTTKLISVTVIR